MSLQGTFNTAVQAMNSQSQFMSNIATNIANVNTTAYKAQDTHFATLLNHVTPSDKRFFTVNTFDFRNVDKQGTIASTNRAFDLAVSGRGFVVTNTQQDGSGTWQYTRDGAFFGQAVDLGIDTDNNGQNDQGTLLVTANGSFVYGWKADEDGNIDRPDSLSALTPVLFSNDSIFPARATSAISMQGNLSSVDRGRQNVGLQFFDADGQSRTLSIGFTDVPTGVNEFNLDMECLDADGQPVVVDFDPPNITFDKVGNITFPTDGVFTVIVNDATGPQTMTVDFSRLTQLGSEGKLTIQSTDQDGYPEGRLDNAYFTKDGVLVGSYTNHEVRRLYQLPIATFEADNNLEAKPGNIFVQTREAGSLRLNSIGSPTGRTQFVVGALEQSTVDLADQFSKMIVTQRAYSSAATVLRTADEMTQAARDLKR
jgi:flagellar hook protein FlgE